MRAGLAQGELAAKLGVAQTSLSAWEKGHYLPNVKYIPNNCKILNCTVNELLEGSG